MLPNSGLKIRRYCNEKLLDKGLLRGKKIAYLSARTKQREAGVSKGCNKIAPSNYIFLHTPSEKIKQKRVL